jgi:regulation of enolase protein 1 (concanavalin A-like superfamily)
MPGADHPGFGTLLFTRPPAGAVERPPAVPPAAPGAVIAQGSPDKIVLKWVASIGAADYTIRRGTTSRGAYTNIVTGISSTTYTDAGIQPHQLYYYVVSASNPAGASPEAYEVSVSAGPPEPWSQQDIGSVAVPGDAGFDGHTFTIEGAGTEIGGTNDQFHFVSLPLDGDGTIMARFVPQVSSQFAQFGVMMRETLTADSAQVALLFVPTRGARRNVEVPAYNAQLMTRAAGGGQASVTARSGSLGPPHVTYGRLMQPYWLRMERKGGSFSGAISPDGQTWTEVGTATVALKSGLFVGLAACSRLATVTTTVEFDHVAAQGRW